MALHVSVARSRVGSKNGSLLIEGSWEDGKFWGEHLIPADPTMTAAETVEFFFLEQGLVASWGWSKDCCGEHLGKLHGQFVGTNGSGGKSFKEVTYSQAHAFDL